MRTKEKLKDAFILLTIILTWILFLSFFKIKHSMTFINLDELLWMYRSRFFIDRLISFDFSNLIQSSQPGIMVMWLAGPFMETLNYNFGSISDFINHHNNSGIPYNIINDQNQQLYSSYKEISFLFNIPILGLIFMFIFSLYGLLRKLGFDRWAVVFSLLLVVTTPYYIYFTTPTDKLVGIFSTLSLLSLLVCASKKGGKKFLIFSAILCSWAALTKLSALFLVFFSLFVLVFYNFKFQVSSFKFQKYDLRFTIYEYINWLAVFLLTSVIFLPTIIADPRSILNFFIKEGSERTIVQNYSVFLNLKIITAYLSDSFMLSFNLFVIILFIAFLFLIIQRIKSKITVKKEIAILIAYSLFFFVFTALFSKTYSFRYLVPALIVFQITAGVGIYEFSGILAERAAAKDRNKIYLGAIVFILLCQGLLIYYSEIEKIKELPYFG